MIDARFCCTLQEFVDNGALLPEEIITTPIEEPRCWKIIRDVFLGLDYLHSNLIVHMDIKPSNILLSSQPPPHGLAKICDFGMANTLRCKNDKMTTQKGSMAFMAVTLSSR